MKLSVHDKQAYKEAELLKDEVIVSLSGCIKELKEDINERREWLSSDDYSKTPELSRIYNKRKTASIMNAEDKIITKRQAKTLTSATKSLISAVDGQASIEINKTKKQMTFDFNKDLKSEPYTEMDEDELDEVQEEFNKRLEKEIKRIKKAANNKIADIIASQPSNNKKTLNQSRSIAVDNAKIPEIIQLRKQHAKQYQELDKELKEFEDEDRRLFEEQLIESDDMTAAELLQARKENEIQIEKEKKRKFAEFNNVATMEVRIAKGKFLKGLDVDNLMDIYTNKANNTIMFGQKRMEWNDILLAIDAYYGAMVDWESFVTQACNAWSNIGDARRSIDHKEDRSSDIGDARRSIDHKEDRSSDIGDARRSIDHKEDRSSDIGDASKDIDHKEDRSSDIGDASKREEMNERIQIYATLYADENGNSIVTDKDSMIIKLKTERDNLLEDVLELDQTIAVEVKNYKLHDKFTQRKLKIEAAKTAKIVARPMVVPAKTVSKKNDFAERCKKIMEEEMKNDKCHKK